MIKNILVGDITAPKNPADIIIGMNTALEDVTGIGLRFVRSVIPDMALDLGSVISFDFDAHRKLHMIICHRLGRGGWGHADQHVRFGMDHLNHLNDRGRDYSIVQIGTGRIGMRDGADAPAIRAAMAASYLPVNLYIFDAPGEPAVVERAPLRALYAWHPTEGHLRAVA